MPDRLLRAAPAIARPQGLAEAMVRLRSRLPAICGAVCSALGLLVLIGWALDLPAATSLLPGLIAMQPWTAVAFLLCGLALLGGMGGGRPRARLAAAAVGLIGAIALAEHVFGLDFGVDRLLFRRAVESQAVGIANPGRPAETTSVCWVLLALALMLAQARSALGRAVFSASATVTLALAAVSLLGYLFGAETLYGALGFTNLALHTAAGLTVASIGVLALRPDAGWLSLLSGDSVGAEAARRLGPLIVGLPVLVGFVAQQGSRAGLYSADFRLALLTFVNTALLLGVTLWAAGRLNRLDAVRRAERERLQIEARLRMAIEAGRLGAWSFDVPTRTVTWDARTQEMFGVSGNGSLRVEEFLRLIHPEDRRRVSEVGERALDPAGDGRYDVEHRVVRPDGRTVWVSHDGQVVFDQDGRPVEALGITTDITERKQAELHQQLMVHELNHRVKNTLATVQAIAAQSLRHDADPEAAKRSFTARLIALSRAHDLLTAKSWEGADLAEVVRAAVEPFDGEGRFDLEGPAVRLSPKAALSLALALHELGTNAAKYGALREAAGRVAVRWSVDDQARRWSLEWRESGGPAVRVPERRGFGSRLIERGLAGELGGEVNIAYEPDGVICTISAPLEAPDPP
ncbi:MAG: PAS domain-containing protein [Pseudomonadota bacterium]|nr:PAS domain-containing protein [Pseudomonadota bacterium]